MTAVTEWVRLGWGMVAGGRWGGGLKVLVLGGDLVAGMAAALGGERAGSLSRVESSSLLSSLLSSSLVAGCQNVGATLLWQVPRGFLLVGWVWVLWWGREGGGGGVREMFSWGNIAGVGARFGSSAGWCHGRFLGPRLGGSGWRAVSC